MGLKDWEGLVENLDNESYHARDEFSASQIVEARTSGFHYLKSVILGERPESDALEFGTLAHEAIHEGRFGEFTCMPEFKPYQEMVPGKRDGTTKLLNVTKKSQEEKWLSENINKRIITLKEYKTIERMREVFLTNTDVSSLLREDDFIEASYLYYDEIHKINCRFRPDRLNFNTGIVIDYKTTRSASPRGFKMEAYKHGYHIKAAHYLLGLERLFPGTFHTFIWIAQEKEWPSPIATYKLSLADQIMGENQRSELIKKIQHWKSTDHYPSYTEGVMEINLPEFGE